MGTVSGEDNSFLDRSRNLPEKTLNLYGTIQQVQRLLKKETRGKGGGDPRPVAYFLTCSGDVEGAKF